MSARHRLALAGLVLALSATTASCKNSRVEEHAGHAPNATATSEVTSAQVSREGHTGHEAHDAPAGEPSGAVPPGYAAVTNGRRALRRSGSRPPR